MDAEITDYFDRFVFYDFETSGTPENYSDDPESTGKEQPQIQDVGYVVTDSDLNITDEGNILVRPKIDINPHPMAIAITRIHMDQLYKKGKSEFEAIGQFQDLLLQEPRTAISGYNTVSFDDEVLRNSLFRNLRDPYVHEWKDGNGRFDIYPLIQMVYAYRPDILEWPVREDGVVSLKLEDLSKANGIVHENAHDALSDVKATIGLAKMVKERAPKLWNHSLWLTRKTNKKPNAMNLLAKPKGRFVFQTTTFFGKDCAMTRPVYPLVIDQKNANKFHCIDLTANPEDLKLMLQKSPDEIAESVFTSLSERPEGSFRSPLSNVTCNKGNASGVADATPLLVEKMAKRFKYDPERVEANLQFVLNNERALQALVSQAMVSNFPPPEDPYHAIYDGFASKEAKDMMVKLHSRDSNLPSKKMITESPFMPMIKKLSDKEIKKYGPLVMRAKYNNFYEDLLARNKAPANELKKWLVDLESRIIHGKAGSLTFDRFHEELAMVRKSIVLDNEQEEALNILEEHIKEKEHQIIPQLRQDVAELTREKEGLKP